MKTSLRRELGIAPNALMILMLAVYEPRKGHAFIFEVMQQVIRFHPEAYLVVCGDGEKNEVQTVREYLQALPVQPNVILLGHRDDTGSLLSQADVVVVPSQRQESFGYTAVEAMASGVPVITTDVGGLPEVVENGVTGWIVEKDNVATFAWKLVELLTDAEVRKRMGEAGRRRVQEKFLAERMALEYVSLMKSVMRK
jgi:glycosyltransferase involved in cell wall biosynthesis